MELDLTECVLDRVALRPLEDEEHWHVFSTRYPPGAPLAEQALNPNPNSKARYARPSSGDGMFYVARYECTAIWESLLQHASVNGDGFVTLDPSHRVDQAIAQLRRDLATPVSALDLRTPYRYRVVDQNTSRDQAWMASLIVLTDYTPTHAPAETAVQRCAAEGQRLQAIVYPSRRNNEDYAAVYYAPPGSVVPWTLAGAPWRLDTVEGEVRLADALWEQGFTWVGDPAADPEAQPEPGAL